MKTQIKLLLLSCTVTLLSCSTREIKVSNDLKSNADVYRVSGNSGILINKKITFGNYHTSPVKRGVSTASEVTLFGLNKTSAEQTIKFTQHAPDGKSADIFAMNLYNNNQFDLLKGFEKYFTSFQNGFLAIITPDHSPKVWKLYISNDDSGTGSKTATDHGYAIDETGNEIKIIGTKYLANNNFLTNNNLTFGFEMVQDGQSIGAVSVLNNGNVWIRKDLPADMKLVVAGIASALMTKNNLRASMNL